MENETVGKTSDWIMSLIYISVFLGVALLALVLIFGAINSANLSSNGVVLNSTTATNETGAYINATGYTLANAGLGGFSSPAIIYVINATSNATIPASNYTLTGNILYNSSAIEYNFVSVTYSYNYDVTNSSGINAELPTIQNNILGMISNFFSLMPTIGTILAICLLVAVIVLLVIYVRSMRQSNQEHSGDVFQG